jgi:16S rRNA processing protein RimM
LKLSSKVKEAVIGMVTTPHGLDGVVKVFPYTDYAERIKNLDLVSLKKKEWKKEMLIEKASVSGRFWLIKFKGVDNRNEASALRECLLTIPLDQRVALPENSYYHDQLIGLMVVNIAGEKLGMVVDIITAGGHDQLVVEEIVKMKRVMIPAVKQFILNVDQDKELLTVDLPEGLLDL